MEHTCKTCRFYDPFPDRPSMGRCRRHAPRPGTTAHWPSVNDFDWCGEWQEKPHQKPSPPARRVARWVRVEDLRKPGRNGES